VSNVLAMSSRDRKTLAAGVVGILMILAAGRVIPLWREWDGQSRTSAVELTAQLASLEEQLELLPVLRDSARVRGVRAAAAWERLIESPTAGAAGANLATQVADIADDLGVKVSAVQIRPDTLFRSGFARVAVSFTATGDVTHLTDLLAALEASDALMAVRELTVTPADVLLPDGRPEVIRFQLLIEALAVKSAPKDGRGTGGAAAAQRTRG
jgi:hypothetical protein